MPVTVPPVSINLGEDCCCEGDPCCPGVTIPTTLYAEITSDCTLIDGLVIPLVWNGTAWVGEDVFECDTCGVIQLSLTCGPSGWALGISFLPGEGSETCEVGARIGGTSVFTLESCDPFLAEVNDNTVSQIGIPECCPVTNINVVISE